MLSFEVLCKIKGVATRILQGILRLSLVVSRKWWKESQCRGPYKTCSDDDASGYMPQTLNSKPP